jgi:hypothetical protein
MEQVAQYLRDYLGTWDNVVSVKTYNAAGDGIFRTNGAINSGDKTLTCATGIFTSSDVGKLIKVGKAGTSGTTLITTIASINSNTSVELTAAAASTITTENFTYGTDDTAAITAARDFCWNNGNKTLVFPDGRYCFTTLEFARSFWIVSALGENVWLESFRSTSGPAVSLDGLSYDATYGVYRFTFGGAYPFNIRGNSNCSSVLYYNNIHFSSINANLRDGNIGILGDNVSGGGTAGPGAAVDTDFMIRLAHHDLDVFDTVPAVGWYMTETYACRIRMQIEVSGGTTDEFGVYMASSNGNVFLGGTVESCNYGGLWLTSTCNRNTFINTHNEVNGAGPDWKIDGHYNTLIGCAGAATYSGIGTAANIINGDYNQFIGGEFNDFEVGATADYTRAIGCNLSTGTISDNGTNTTFEGCAGQIDKAPVPVVSSITLGSGIADTGTPYRTSGCFRTRAGLVQIDGVVTMSTVSGHPTTIATLPAGYRPSVSISYPAYNLTTDVPIGLVLNSSGVLSTRAAVATSDVISITSPPFRPA